MTLHDTRVPEAALQADPPTPHPTQENDSSHPQIPPGYLSQQRRDGERYDSYRGVIFQIPDTRYRVAVCLEGRQWLLQQRKGKDQWKNKKHCSRKENLLKRLHELLPTDDYLKIKSRVEALPI